MNFETAYYSALAVGALMLLWLYRGAVRRLWARLPSPWATMALVVVLGMTGGAVAGAPLIGLAAGVIVAAAIALGVKPSTADDVDYGEYDEGGDGLRGVIPAGGKAETVKSAETETPRNAPVAGPAFDVNALRHEARAAALGALLAHGLIKEGKRTEAMRAVFGKVTGDAYTRAAGAVKRHEQQVLATLPPVESAEPEAPRLIPVNGGKEGYIEL